MNHELGQSRADASSTPILCRCMPFGALNRRMSDSCGEAIYPQESIHDTLQTLAWAADEHLIEAFSAWDDDIMPWSADSRGQVVDQQDQLLMRDIQDFIEENGIRLNAFGCDLTREAAFANGALTNPSEAIRNLAWRKLERAVLIASALRADSFRIFIGREGVEEPLHVSWETAFAHLCNGLKYVHTLLRRRPIRQIELHLGYSRGLRRHLFLASPAQAMFLLNQMESAKAWQICLEDDSLQDISTFALMAQNQALPYLPFGTTGNQGWTENIANTVQLLAILRKLQWHGPAECVGLAFRTEAIPEDRELFKRQFITNSITALTIAIQQSEHLVKDWDKGLAPSEVGIMAAAMAAKLNPDDILRKATASDTSVPAAVELPSPAAPAPSTPKPSLPAPPPPASPSPSIPSIPKPSLPAPLPSAAMADTTPRPVSPPPAASSSPAVQASQGKSSAAGRAGMRAARRSVTRTRSSSQRRGPRRKRQ